jgi:hypothetical protein
MRPCTNSQSYRCPAGERLLLFRIWKFFFDKAGIACASFNVALWFATVAVLFRESKVSCGTEDTAKYTCFTGTAVRSAVTELLASSLGLLSRSAMSAVIPGSVKAAVLATSLAV